MLEGVLNDGTLNEWMPCPMLIAGIAIAAITTAGMASLSRIIGPVPDPPKRRLWRGRNAGSDPSDVVGGTGSGGGAAAIPGDALTLGAVAD